MAKLSSVFILERSLCREWKRWPEWPLIGYRKICTGLTEKRCVFVLRYK